MKKSLLLLFVVSLFTIDFSFAQSSKKYPSRFWEISGNGLTKPSYLYGTMHVSKKLAYYLPDTFFIALNNVDVVALENNPDLTLEEMVNSELFGIANNSQLKLGNGNFYKNAFLVTVPVREDYAKLLAADPDLVNEMMFRFSDISGERGDFEESTYLDLFIYQCGKRLNKQITGLETFDGSMKLYLKAINPENAKIEKKEKDKDSIIDENDEDAGALTDKSAFKQIEDAYRAGDLDVLDSISKKTYPTKLYGKYLINDRNIIMVNNMDSIMRKQSLFTGVGSAHLPGNEGVIELLRKKGYTVKPIALDKIKDAAKMKDKLEAQRLPLNYNTFTSDDNVFSVDVPKKMYETYVFDELKQYLCIDAANAAYYTIYRIKSHNEFSGYDIEKNKKRIDSLFYEFIPGKIMKKTEITKNNYPGFDIITKTQRGDIRRYVILITPLEVIIFKASGTGDYLLQKDNDRFFNSIKLNINPDNTTLFKPEYGGYEVQLPGYIVFDKKNKNVRNDKRYEKTYAYDNKGNTYMVMRANYNDYKYIEEDTFELSYLTEMMNANLKYDVVSKKITTQDKHPAFEIVLKSKEGKYLNLKTIVNGPQYYLLGIVSDKNKMDDPFFSSLKFTKNIYDKPFFKYEDTSMYYTVTTCIKPFEDQIVNYASYNNITGKYNKKDSKPYESLLLDKTFENSKTQEKIYLSYEKLHDYLSIKNVDSFWNAEIEYYTKTNGLKLSRLDKSSAGNLTTYNLLLTDTNSTRGIMTKIVMKHGRMYYLKTTIDTISGPTEFVDKFYSSFTPTDTLIGYSPFVNKTDMFFKALESSDSSKRNEAINALGYIHFQEPAAATRFASFFKGSNYYNYKEADRIDIIDKYADLKDKNTLPVLLTLYAKAGDSSNLQFSILNAISKQKNAAAIRILDSILLNEAPVPLSDYEVNNVFYPWYDTLKLAVKLFPNLLKLTKYEEYKTPIYSLLSTLVDSNIISSQAYVTYKQDILREANETLKRFNTKEQKNETDKKDKEDEDAYVSETDTYTEQSALTDYMKILLPFYSEPNIKTFFDKLIKTKKCDLLLELYAQQLLKKIPVNDTIWNFYAKDISTRYKLFDKLEAVKRLDMFPSQYKNQQAIAESVLRSSGYTEAADTITFLEKVQVNQKSDSGWVYFFKTYYSKEKKYYLDFVGLMPYDTAKIKTRFADAGDYDDDESYKYSSQAVKWNKNKLDELKHDILNKFRLADRERVVLYDYTKDISGDYNDRY